MSLPTLEDLKPYLNAESDVDDDELADMLDAALDVVEGIIGPVGLASITETHYNVTADVIVLRQMPVAELVSVSWRYGSTSTAQTLGDFELDPSTGILRAASGWRLSPGTYTVTYTAGSDDIPARRRLAILIVAGHLWETQRGTSPSALALQQPDVDPSFSPGRGYAIPNRALELLAPDIRPSIA